MKITGDEVRRIADLSRLRLTDREIELFRDQLSNILTYMDTLNELHTEDVEPTSHVLPLKNVFRHDSHRTQLDAKSALFNAPDQHNDLYRVPKIIE